MRLFANGLDNAIEACLALPSASRRLSVRARTDKGLLMMRIRNRTADLSPLAPGCLPESSKPNRSQHGLGLRSLQEIVTRYQGTLSLQRAQGMFELLVTIPLPPNPSLHSRSLAAFASLSTSYFYKYDKNRPILGRLFVCGRNIGRKTGISCQIKVTFFVTINLQNIS